MLAESCCQPQAGHLIHVQVLAFLAVAAGAALGIIMWRRLVKTPLLTAHACVGLIILTFAVLQVLALAWRARPGTKLRSAPDVLCGRRIKPFIAAALTLLANPLEFMMGRSRCPALWNGIPNLCRTEQSCLQVCSLQRCHDQAGGLG